MTLRLGALAALTIVSAACSQQAPARSHSSVTAKLPPARPAVAAPGFAFEAAGRATRR